MSHGHQPINNISRESKKKRAQYAVNIKIQINRRILISFEHSMDTYFLNIHAGICSPIISSNAMKRISSSAFSQIGILENTSMLNTRVEFFHINGFLIISPLPCHSGQHTPIWRIKDMVSLRLSLENEPSNKMT